MAPTVDNDIFRDFLQLLVDMKPAYQPDYMTQNHHDVGILFGQGRIGMVIAGTWIWALNEDIEDQPWLASAPVPKMCEASPMGSYGGGWAIAVSSQSSNLDAAFELAKAMFDHDLSAHLHTDVTPMVGADALSDLFNNPSPHATTFRAQMPHARRLSPALTIYESEFERILWEEISNVIIGRTTIDAAIGNIESRMIDIMD
jgi:ABC-type glycerol-3-phosphate transport system substrate-binding protein